MAAGDELRQRELRLLAARERAGVLEHLVAAQPEHAEQVAQRAVARGRRLAHVLEQRAPGDDALVLLRVVADRHVRAELDLAEVGAELVGQHLEQRGLARAVEAHDEQPLAAADVEVHVGEHVERAERLPQLGGGEHGAPADGGSGNRTASARRFAVFCRPALASSLAPALSRFLATRARLAVWPRIPSACALSRAISRAWRSASFAVRSSSRFARREVLRVGALVLDERAGALLRLAVDVHDAGDRLVEEVEVVAHDEQRAAVRRAGT